MNKLNENASPEFSKLAGQLTEDYLEKHVRNKSFVFEGVPLHATIGYPTQTNKILNEDPDFVGMTENDALGNTMRPNTDDMLRRARAPYPQVTIQIHRNPLLSVELRPACEIFVLDSRNGSSVATKIQREEVIVVRYMRKTVGIKPEDTSQSELLELISRILTVAAETQTPDIEANTSALHKKIAGVLK